MRTLANFVYRRRRYVVAGWIVAFVAIIALSGAFKGEFNTRFTLPGSESQNALDLLKESGAEARSGIQGQVVFQAQQGVDDPAVRQTIEKLLADIRSNPDVGGVETVSPYEPGKEHQVADGGKIAYA